MYEGPPGGAPAAFERCGLPCPPDTFIAEHMLEVRADMLVCVPTCWYAGLVREGERREGIANASAHTQVLWLLFSEDAGRA